MIARVVAYLVLERILDVGGGVVDVGFLPAVGEGGTVACRETQGGVEA